MKTRSHSITSTSYLAWQAGTARSPLRRIPIYLGAFPTLSHNILGVGWLPKGASYPASAQLGDASPRQKQAGVVIFGNADLLCTYLPTYCRHGRSQPQRACWRKAFQLRQYTLIHDERGLEWLQIRREHGLRNFRFRQGSKDSNHTHASRGKFAAKQVKTYSV